jgi:putative transferase (TIGR04331 family)
MNNFITFFDKKILNPSANYLYYGHVTNEINNFQKNNSFFKIVSIATSKDEKKDNYEKCEKIFNKIIKNLSRELNRLHNLKYDQRIWEIIFGRWIKDFIYICFRNFHSIETVINNSEIKKIYSTNDKNENFVTNNWFSLYYSSISEKWVSNLNYKILKFLVPTKEIEVIENFEYNYKKSNNPDNKNFLNNYFLNLAIKFYNIFRNNIKTKNEIFFYNSGLSLLTEKKIETLLGQIPSFRKFPEHYYNDTINYGFRENLIIDFKAENKFEFFLKQIIKMSLPKFIIEEFRQINVVLDNLKLPNDVNSVITGTGFVNELFNIYVAKNVSKKKKYLILQHGNAYYTNYANDYLVESQTADYTISWGAKVKNTDIPAFNIKTIKTRNKFNLKGNLTIVCNKIASRAEPFDSFFDKEKRMLNIINFAKNLDNNIKEKTFFRFFPENEKYNGSFKSMLLENNIKNYKDYLTFHQILRKTRICLFNYDSTGFYENLHNQIPSIVFLEDPFEELNDKFVKEYQLLQKSKIIFSNQTDLYNHLNNVWDEPLSWWWDKTTQQAINSFNKKLNIPSNGEMNKLIKILKDMKNN